MDIKKINGFAVVSALDEGLLGRYNSALYFKQFKDELLNKIKGNGVGKENFKGSLKLIRSELLKASIQEKLLFYFDVDAVFNSLLLDNLKNIENMKFDVESAGIVKKLLETLFYNVFENNKLFLDFLSEELASLKIKKGAADILSTLRAAKELGEQNLKLQFQTENKILILSGLKALTKAVLYFKFLVDFSKIFFPELGWYEFKDAVGISGVKNRGHALFEALNNAPKAILSVANVLSVGALIGATSVSLNQIDDLYLLKMAS